VVNLAARRPGLDRLYACIERLQNGRVHAPDLVWYLADDDAPCEVAVIVAGPAGGKDVDDDRRARPDRALTTEVRHRAFRRAGDDHVRAHEAPLTQEQRRARIQALGGEKAVVEPQNPLPDVRLGELAHHLNHRNFGGALRRFDEPGFIG
jgi:hypothetical protein